MALLSAFGAIALAVFVAWHQRGLTSVEKVKRALSRADVDSGCTSSRLLAVLDSLGVRHGNVVTLAGRPPTIYANFGRTSSTWIVYGELLGEFVFDKDGRLVTSRLKEALTGP